MRGVYRGVRSASECEWSGVCASRRCRAFVSECCSAGQRAGGELRGENARNQRQQWMRAHFHSTTLRNWRICLAPARHTHAQPELASTTRTLAMASDADEAELSPAEHLAHIARMLPADSSESTLLAASSDAEDHVTELYRAQSSPEGRRQMLSVDYAESWSPIVRGAVAAMSAAADSALRTPTPTGASSRAMAVIRVIVILRNLCTEPTFQRELRNDAISVLCGRSEALRQATRLVSIVERSIAQESRAKEPRLMLKSLMQLVANMLTPAAAASTDAAGSTAASPLSDAPWLWVHEAFYPAVLAPVLRLHRSAPELASIATAIVHHALLCGDAQHSLEADVNPRTRACVPQMLAPAASSAESVDASTAAAVAASVASVALSSAVSSPSMLKLLLVAAVSSVESQLQAVFDAEAESAHKAPLSLWDWRPHVAEPCWIVSLVGLGLRSHGSFLRQCNAQCNAQEWVMLVRIVEVWTQGMHEEEDRTKELAKMRAASASKAAASGPVVDPAATEVADGGRTDAASRLKVTAENIAANAVFLLEWMQQREQVPLPPMPTPTADAAAPTDSSAATAAAAPASETASSSSASAPVAPSPAATSTIPIDHLSNSVLASLGSLLLFQGWSGTVVFHSLRAALSRSGVLVTVLSMLSAADRIDGGAMFSDLYRPVKAGHTRHTKESDDPEAYVNQFAAPAESAPASSSSTVSPAPRAASATGGSPAPSSAPRATPYLFKSNCLRLLSSLVWRHRGMQDEVGVRGGIYALMNHSVLDEHNPLMREFAILGLRNALEDHEANQRIVSELRVNALANQDQLREMGVNTELDPMTGKIKIGQGDKKQDQA